MTILKSHRNIKWYHYNILSAKNFKYFQNTFIGGQIMTKEHTTIFL